MRRMKIIDNDEEFVRRVQLAFEAAGYELEKTGRSPDLLLVSADAAAHCRARYPDAAIIAVANVSEAHPDALRHADESVLRSASMRELVARADAVLRRVSTLARESAAYEDEELRIYPDTMRVVRDGRQIFLSKGEADVLALLIRHSPASLPVERIREEVSNGRVSRSAIEARLKGLRRKVGSHLITNRIGFGYAFQPRHPYNPRS
ncbi:MAG TPA: winged helix-turn-helix domain-containing protein [Thermoanaerobaculia bacterium]|nr:winged helix-turn-helix domain-containing protein [Thermoanaerobaculia bacterium]